MNISSLFLSAVSCAALCLVGCGGGGGDSAAVTPSQPVAQSVVGTHADGSRYVGTWNGDCASIMVGTQLHSVQYTITVSGVASNVLSGTITVYDFGTNFLPTCNAQPTVIGPVPVTLTVDPVVVAASGYLAGGADKVTIAQAGQTDRVTYMAFTPDFHAFWLGTAPQYTNTNVQYTKVGG